MTDDGIHCGHCGHPESDHSLGGRTGMRCLAYPGGCDCEGFMVGDYDAFGMSVVTMSKDDNPQWKQS